MTDGRSGGDLPPASGPPPLAPEAPPAAPAQPATPLQQPPRPASAPRPTGFWMTMIALAFAGGVGITLLFLWLTGPIGSARAPATRGGASNTSAASANLTTPAVTPQVPAPPPAQAGYAPNATALEGVWGPNCPGSRSEAVTFFGDGTMEADDETGSWSVSGYEVTLNGERDTTIVRWEMLGNDSARVSRPGGASRIVNRCN